MLESSPYLLGNDPGIADIGVMPFIRQSAHIDSDVFGQLPYPNLQRWLQHWLEHPLFLQTMIKL
ncbi:MAG: glutathione S-transferase C-terminal domain-containing protein, partial [Alcanivorax sp.]|uniref:glutathione S-transferase C-terminal domain-containing protein n=1 Tax=Alcanivorax sp. TaxID=1872427 RepID=UPI002639ADCC